MPGPYSPNLAWSYWLVQIGPMLPTCNLAEALLLSWLVFTLLFTHVQPAVVPVVYGVLSCCLVLCMRKVIVLNAVTFQHLPTLLEEWADLLLCGLLGQVSNEQFHHPDKNLLVAIAVAPELERTLHNGDRHSCLGAPGSRVKLLSCFFYPDHILIK